jgi:hypothetical protein
MADSCPFINRADKRCSGHFNLDGLEAAFAHCFGDFESCPHHAQMSCEEAVIEKPMEESDGRNRHARSPVQITVTARRSQRLAAAA